MNGAGRAGLWVNRGHSADRMTGARVDLRRRGPCHGIVINADFGPPATTVDLATALRQTFDRSFPE